MSSSSEETAVKQLINERQIRHVECVFPDVNGFPRGKIMRASDFAAGKELRIPLAIVLQTITGDYPDDAIIGETDKDLLLIPDSTTFRVLPWAPETAWVIHDCVDFENQLAPLASRSVLKQVLAKYRDKGLQPVVAAEIEFYLFSRDGKEDAGFTLPGQRGGGREVGQSAFSVESSNELAKFWRELYEAFDRLDIRTDTWLHEMGPSQFEINLWHGDPLLVADQVLLFKYTLREIAARNGLYAVFMAKPLAGEAGSSMHLHQSVVDNDGNNIFSQANAEASGDFYAFIGGLQRYLPEVMPIFAPFVNSWRRYVNESAAPINMEWGGNNRTVALRVPNSSADARRVENRIPGSDANPYLAIATSLACGLLGMERNLEPRAPVHELSGYARPREIPKGLESALEKMHASAAARQMLGDAFVDGFCDVKATELNHYMNEVSAWDRRFLTLQT